MAHLSGQVQFLQCINGKEKFAIIDFHIQSKKEGQTDSIPPVTPTKMTSIKQEEVIREVPLQSTLESSSAANETYLKLLAGV